MRVGTIPILTEAYGTVPAGETCAILGQSGAGKSTLLNVLSGRQASRGKVVVDSQMEVGDKKVDPRAFRKHVAYVMQEDALMATATPREAILFSARLRLNGASLAECENLTSVMLEELGLESCADVMIGGELIKGISGGQRKRTSIGVELVTNPSLVFLDEPTSGLDAEAARNIVEMMSKVAKAGACVLCTIHQPSSEIFGMFDGFQVLKDGRVLYQGSTANVCEKWALMGFECPPYYNPADHVIEVASRHENQKLKGSGLFLTHSESSNNLKAMDTSGGGHPSESASLIPPVSASLGKQLSLLFQRELKNLKRDKAALGGRFGVTIFLNLLFGLIFDGAGGRDDSDADNLGSHFGALAMVTISSMFGAAQPIMLNFPMERPVFLREYSTATYGSVAYFITKILIELPLTYLQCIVAYTLTYFLLELRGSFFVLVTYAWLLGMSSASVAVIIGCSVKDVKSVAELAPAVFVPQLLFAGFFVRTSFIPTWLRWAQYLCALKYALNLLTIEEFSRDGHCEMNTDNPSVSCAMSDNLLEANDIKVDEEAVYIGVLLALFVSFRLIAAIILKRKAAVFF